MPSQVKQAEKRRQRSPLLPIYGILIAVCLYIVAYALENPLTDLIRKVAPQSGLTLPPPDLQFSPFVMPSGGRLLFAVIIWAVLLAFAYFLVAMLSGRDPDSAKDLQLPPRTKAEKRKRYSRD